MTETDIHHLQVAANVVMVYLSKGELDSVKIYVECTPKILGETDFDNLIVCVVYYGTVTYYHKIEDYDKAAQLCERGTKYNKEHKSTYTLECLFCKIVSCRKQSGEDDYLERYTDTEEITRFNGSDYAVKVIRNDLE